MVSRIQQRYGRWLVVAQAVAALVLASAVADAAASPVVAVAATALAVPYLAAVLLLAQVARESRVRPVVEHRAVVGVTKTDLTTPL